VPWWSTDGLARPTWAWACGRCTITHIRTLSQKPEGDTYSLDRIVFAFRTQKEHPAVGFSVPAVLENLNYFGQGHSSDFRQIVVASVSDDMDLLRRMSAGK